MLKFLQKIFGTANDRALKAIRPKVAAINALEPTIAALSDDALKGKTAEFRQRLANGAPLDDLLIESFAVVREASKRVLGMRPYDVQLIGGLVLHDGKIAEMKTGEGKTLVATLPCYLNALPQKGVHVVTVNDYLARRDAEWMGQLYRWLGLTTGVIVHGLDDAERQRAYGCDITYGQNNEYGFDYLRDNMKYDLRHYVQRELNYAVIDEVDSILIDEARTPLIISGAPENSSELYIRIDKLIPKLKKDIHYNIDEKAHSATLTEEGVEYAEHLLHVGNLYDPSNIVLLHHVNNALRAHTLYRRDVNYLVKDGEVLIIDEHTGRLMPGRRWSEGLHQAIEAKEGVEIQAENYTLATISFQNYFRLYNKISGMTGTAKTEEEEFQKTYKRDVIVIPTNNPVKRIDHQDLIYRTERGKFRACVQEIKERHAKGQPILVGTASVEKSEIVHKMLNREGIEHSVLNAKQHAREAAIVAQAGRLGAVTVATNMAGRGTDIILGGNAEYWGQALIEEAGIAVRHTPLWEKVEDFVKLICIRQEDKAREMLQDPELRAIPEHFIQQIAEKRDLFREEQAKVREAGGLFILGTERHESRRIDNQLRGRAGRQGDPGASRFYLSLEDDLMRIFGEKMTAIMDFFGMNDDAPIQAGMVSRRIEDAQRNVESHYFDMRKNMLEYDDVMDQQRKTIYKWRRSLLGADEKELHEKCLDAIEDLVINLVDARCNDSVRPEEWEREQLIEDVLFQFNHQTSLDEVVPAKPKYKEHIYFEVEKPFLAKVAEVDANQKGLMFRLEKDLFLRTIDELWKNHLQVMDQLRTGINLRGYGQRDPKKEYQKEGFRLFSDLLIRIKSKVMGQLFRLKIRSEEEVQSEEEKTRARLLAQQEKMRMLAASFQKSEDSLAEAQAQAAALAQAKAQAAAQEAPKPKRPKIGRNDPCWCGSGKKYKKCHGATELEGEDAED